MVYFYNRHDDNNSPIQALVYVTGFTKTVRIGTRNEIQFIADY